MSALYPDGDRAPKLEAVWQRDGRFHYFFCLPLQPRGLNVGEMASILNDEHNVRAAGLLSMRSCLGYLRRVNSEIFVRFYRPRKSEDMRRQVDSEAPPLIFPALPLRRTNK